MTINVLIVDDSSTMRKILRNILKEIGVSDIYEAEDGQKAIFKLLAMDNPPDVVFLDWDMPKTNGFECLKMIRENPRFNDVKIIMCTAVTEKDKIFQAVQAGANAYILKPVTTEIAREKLTALNLI